MGELTIDAETGLAEIVPFEIAGSEAAVAEVVGATTASLLGSASAVAMGAAASVGALGYLAANGLFDFKTNADSFQHGTYNPRERPKPKYVPPPRPNATMAETLEYLDRKDQADALYQAELSSWSSSSRGSGGDGGGD